MKNILISFVIFSPLVVRADLPLNIEDIMTDKGKLKLDASVTYINSENSRSELAAPIYIQTGSASFIPVPTEIQENGSNSDMLVGTLGLRYGLTGNAEIYGSGSYLWREDRQFDGESSKNRDKHLSDVSLGISHTFLKDDKNPALIGFLEGTLYEKSRGKASSGKSWLIGATTYKAIDPVVLSLTAAYRINGSKTLSDDVKYKGRQLLDAESQYLLRRQRQNQPHGRHPMAGQAARPPRRQKRIRKEYIYLRPSRRRPRLLQSHIFKRIRTLQYFRAEQLRTEIGRTAYVLSRL